MSVTNNNEIIYHYCANEKLVSILKGKTLRMSDIVKSNDYKELLMFFPTIFYKLEDAYKKDSFDLSYGNLDGFDAFRKLLHDIADYVNKEIDYGTITSFVTCFSGAKDKLSQWRGYANDGRGGAIGFSMWELLALAQNSKEIRFEKVQYISQGELQVLIKEIAEELVAKWRNTLIDIDNILPMVSSLEMKNVLLMTLCMEDINKTLIDSLKYKYKGFKEEEEYRLFTVGSSTKISDKGILERIKNKDIRDAVKNEIEAEKIEFIITDDNIISYYPLALSRISVNPIKEIVFGPNNKVVLSDFRLLLANNGWNVDEIKIEHSEISYRA